MIQQAIKTPRFRKALRKLRSMEALREAQDKAAREAVDWALADEAAELKRARIMNRAEPGYERKDGKL